MKHELYIYQIAIKHTPAHKEACVRVYHSSSHSESAVLASQCSLYCSRVLQALYKKMWCSRYVKTARRTSYRIARRISKSLINEFRAAIAIALNPVESPIRAPTLNDRSMKFSKPSLWQCSLEVHLCCMQCKLTVSWQMIKLVATLSLHIISLVYECYFK